MACGEPRQRMAIVCVFVVRRMISLLDVCLTKYYKVMKHLLFIFASTLVAMFMLSSCSNEDETSANPLKSTLWSFDDEVSVFEKDYFTRYIEFVDESTVKVWDTDNGQVYTGKYKVDGNNVTFYNLHDTYWGWYYISGVFSSNSLTISYSYKENQTGGIYHNTYTKEK